jgi:Family of unknown function (DUF6495)
MKYRRLTDIELGKLENRFIQFLVANTITGDDWAKIKVEKPEEASKLIDIFSEMMFETSLKKVEYLKFSEPKDIKIFHCGANSITLMGLTADDKTPVDFTQPFDTKQIMNNIDGLSIYRSEKKYTGNREQELFKMMETGCLITDEHLFGMLEKLYT